MSSCDIDPVLIALVRKTMPNIIAEEICGVQPMTLDSAAIFRLTPFYWKDPVPYKVAVERGYCLELWFEQINEYIIRLAHYESKHSWSTLDQ